MMIAPTTLTTQLFPNKNIKRYVLRNVFNYSIT